MLAGDGFEIGRKLGSNLYIGQQNIYSLFLNIYSNKGVFEEVVLKFQLQKLSGEGHNDSLKLGYFGMWIILGQRCSRYSRIGAREIVQMIGTCLALD